MHRLTPPVLVAVLLCAGSAGAVEIPLPGQDRTLQLRITQTLISEYHGDVNDLVGDDGERYGELKNRTDLVLMHGTTSFNLRFDFDTFVGDYDTTFRQATYAVEKLSLSSIQRSFEVTAGDFYARLGRGLALDLTRIDDLNRDITLRGAMFKVTTPYVDGQAFAGWVNPLDADGLRGIPIWVPSDVIGGGRVEVRPHRVVALGLHYAGAGMEPHAGAAEPRPQRIATHILGASFDFPSLFDVLGIYGEYNFISRVTKATVEQGTGIYLGISGNLKNVALLAEMKYYRRFELRNPDSLYRYNDRVPDPEWEAPLLLYHRPPTLMWKKQQILNNHDVIGPRVQLDYRIASWGSTLWVSYGHFFASEAVADEGFFNSGNTVNDIFGGVQQQLRGGAFDLTGGYRWDVEDQDGTRVTHFSHAFVDGELSTRIYRDHVLELEVAYHKIRKEAASYWSMLLSAGYRPSKYFSAALTYEYTREFEEKFKDIEGVDPRKHFFGVTATTNVTASMYARLFAGSTAGGDRCIDGQCMSFPSFIGARLTLAAQF